MKSNLIYMSWNLREKLMGIRDSFGILKCPSDDILGLWWTMNFHYYGVFGNTWHNVFENLFDIIFPLIE
jgi:hypothetical protein